MADALTVLFERHSPILFGIARRILRNGAEAEDAVQQVFLDVFRSIQQYDPKKGEFKTWLLMFGYQRILNCRRRLVSNRFFNTDSFDELLPELLPVPENTPDFSPAEAHVLVEEVLVHLQPRQRRTIELIYYEGLTAEEVSIRTGETVEWCATIYTAASASCGKALCGGESGSAGGPNDYKSRRFRSPVRGRSKMDILPAENAPN